MKELKVSIIIPVYNVEEYLRDCLESAVNQTMKEIEIIAVNDGSTDGSLLILNEYAQKYSNIRIVNQENKGLSGARNSGLSIALGEYVYFFDSDDVIDLKLCEECYSCAKNDNLDILQFDAEVFYESEVEKEKFYFDYNRSKHIESTIKSGIEYYTSLEGKIYKSSVCIQFFNREFLDKNQLNFLEGILHEDELFTPQALILAKRVKYVPEQYFKRRVRMNSIMTSPKSTQNIRGYFTVGQELYKFYLTNKEMFNDFQSKVFLHKITRFYDSAFSQLCSQIDNSPLRKKIVDSIVNKPEIKIVNKKLWLKIRMYYLYSLYLKLKKFFSF